MRPLYLLVLGVVFLGGCARGPAGGEAPAVVRLAEAFAPAEVVAELSATLARWREWVEERRLPAESTNALSAAELERLRSLGYL